MVFGLKTVTAPVPGGTIGGETRRVYWRDQRAVKASAGSPVGRPAGSEVYPGVPRTARPAVWALDSREEGSPAGPKKRWHGGENRPEGRRIPGALPDSRLSALRSLTPCRRRDQDRRRRIGWASKAEAARQKRMMCEG